ncbi:carbon-nitrogen hydrolase family protein [uncultured Roseobacter sp.]|uniref:carbon-nitrogen hydrolase family protein n=1 Tax=uncultured Roseobacter sp. TaxID=114847 RepID=UPI00261EF224|nr:carbon-nitrogen hydrolase family protein [uncultured Roseobacter sp.]
MKIGAVQARSVWLNRAATVEKIISTIADAERQGIQLLAFPEAFLCGYPFWLCRTNAAAFGDPRQGRAYAQFLEAAAEADSPETARIEEACRDHGVSIVLGMNERGKDGARGSVYCSLLTIDAEKGCVGVHRKLVPTHDERLCWAQGDAHGLKVHDIGGFRVGGLNCWENFMPLSRFALYSGGEEIHIAAWPGNASVAGVSPQFIANEARVWVFSVMGLLSLSDIPDDFEFKADLEAAGDTDFFRGGTVVFNPAGERVAEIALGQEGLVTVEVDHESVGGQRQMKDVAGHYHRSDLFDLSLDARRPTPLNRRE